MATFRLSVIRAAVFAACALCAAGAFAEDLKLTGAQEVPPNDSKAAHIHVGAPGQAGPPIITLVAGDGGTWSVPEGAKLTPAQVASWQAGNLYVNVHTAEHPGGEVRAQFKAP